MRPRSGCLYCHSVFRTLVPVFGTVVLLAKGFCRAKFWARFPFWRREVRGEVFREVCREVFHEVFGLVLLGHAEQKENFSKNFSPKFP